MITKIPRAETTRRRHLQLYRAWAQNMESLDEMREFRDFGPKIKSGVAVREVADEYNIHVRTVQRAIKVGWAIDQLTQAPPKTAK